MIRIKSTLDIELKSNGHPINIDGIPSMVTTLHELYCVLKKIDSMNVCKGNLVEEFNKKNGTQNIKPLCHWR